MQLKDTVSGRNSFPSGVAAEQFHMLQGMTQHPSVYVQHLLDIVD